MGISMGGMGSLRMAFKDPTSFLAVAALEPAIEAAYSYDTTACTSER
jgi:S-formylglutathione hydrolase